jgi:hypothetical protein
MHANDALLAYAALVTTLLFWRTSGTRDDATTSEDDPPPPAAFLISSAMRAAYFAWGAATRGWPPSDADFLPYFASALDGVVLAHLAMKSRNRFKLISLLCLISALAACVGGADWRAAACVVSSCAIAILWTGEQGSMAAENDKLRGTVAIGALALRAGLSLYGDGTLVYIADAIAITGAAYSAIDQETDDA